MNAGAGVLKEILDVVENSGDASVVLKKFAGRYPKDLELLKVNEMYSQFLSTREGKKLDEVKARLKNILSARQLEVSGAGDINLKDRRKQTFSPKRE